MLLWLTLALLWSPTYWAGETFGPGGGTYFSTSRDFQNDIIGIQVFIGPLGLIKRKLDNTFAASRDDIEKVLTGVYGQYTVQSITRISFDWNYPSK